MELNSDWDIPEGLSPLGQKAAEAIRKFMEDNEEDSNGGCTAFYSPQEWKERGERYGTESELLIVYDGGPMSRLCNTYCTDTEAFDKALSDAGVWRENCTHWYGAIYPL